MNQVESKQDKPKLNKGIEGNFPFAETLRNGPEIYFTAGSLCLAFWGAMGAGTTSMTELDSPEKVIIYNGSAILFRIGLGGIGLETFYSLTREFGGGVLRTARNWINKN